MNKLSTQQRANIIRMLVEGNSLRSCSRIADVSINTVSKLLVDVGMACAKFHHENVVNVNSKRVECDEIWAFCGMKQKTADRKGGGEGIGDVWTWTAIDSDTKLAVSFYVGNRDANSANEFMHDVAARLRSRVQLTTDGFKPYLKAVENAFDSEIDYAQLIKIYGSPEGSGNEKRYSPAECTGIKKSWVSGDPLPEHISTSYVERQNLNMRMSMRRFTRLTNAFSKKIENHFYAIALHFVYYNFCRVHKSLRVTPAMEAKLAKKPMSIEELVNLAPIEAPKTRGKYKTKTQKEGAE